MSVVWTGRASLQSDAVPGGGRAPVHLRAGLSRQCSRSRYSKCTCSGHCCTVVYSILMSVVYSVLVLTDTEVSKVGYFYNAALSGSVSANEALRLVRVIDTTTTRRSVLRRAGINSQRREVSGPQAKGFRPHLLGRFEWLRAVRKAPRRRLRRAARIR
jgi:hypothetical protein